MKNKLKDLLAGFAVLVLMLTILYGIEKIKALLRNHCHKNAYRSETRAWQRTRNGLAEFHSSTQYLGCPCRIDPFQAVDSIAFDGIALVHVSDRGKHHALVKNETNQDKIFFLMNRDASTDFESHEHFLPAHTSQEIYVDTLKSCFRDLLAELDVCSLKLRLRVATPKPQQTVRISPEFDLTITSQ